ncbi:MAG: hypothetical protein VX741_02135, partial [Pseudomonadota bacterium]|nr:hypothetical protein [Pseudomonadota bacterium]
VGIDGDCRAVFGSSFADLHPAAVTQAEIQRTAGLSMPLTGMLPTASINRRFALSAASSACLRS